MNNSYSDQMETAGKIAEYLAKERYSFSFKDDKDNIIIEFDKIIKGIKLHFIVELFDFYLRETVISPLIPPEIENEHRFKFSMDLLKNGYDWEHGANRFWDRMRDLEDDIGVRFDENDKRVYCEIEDEYQNLNHDLSNLLFTPARWLLKGAYDL